LEKKKRKRIVTMDSSEDEDNQTPSKEKRLKESSPKLKEFNRTPISTPTRTPISTPKTSHTKKITIIKKDKESSPKLKEFNRTPISTPIRTPISTPKSSPAIKNQDKENNSPPSSTKKLKDKLSLFASPATVKGSKNDNHDTLEFEDTDKNKSEQIQTFAHLAFEFLDPSRIKDKNKHRPDHPDYDPGTLFVPENFLREQTPGQRQWWV
jgi:hypothetical protein